MYHQRVTNLVVTLLLSLAVAPLTHTPPLFAQEAEIEHPPPQAIWERQARQPPGRNILFLIDSSGSMEGREVSDAINFAMQIAGAPVDDFHIALVTFGSNAARWAGTEDTDESGNPVGHPGFSAMPSSENLEDAREWIESNLDGGSTFVSKGLRHAILSTSGTNDSILTHLGIPATSLNDITIVLITDGEFSEDLEEVESLLQELATLRENNGLPSANFGLVGINVDTEPSHTNPITVHSEMLDLSENFALGYLRLVYP